MELNLDVLAIPVFVFFILLEARWRAGRGHPMPRAQVRASAALGLGMLATNALQAAIVGALFVLASRHRLLAIPDTPTAWAATFLAGEFTYYWVHRLSHEVRWLWATHAVHHSSEDLNLGAALRNGWTDLVSGTWLAWLGLALVGFDPLLTFFFGGAMRVYGFFLHTEAVPRLGVLEWVLNTPSHHRVHHALNSHYIDRNYGGVLIVFDRLFGTFARERDDVQPKYGVQPSMLSANPLSLAFHEWRRLGADLRRARGFREVLLTAFGPPQPAFPSMSAKAQETPAGRRQRSLPLAVSAVLMALSGCQAQPLPLTAQAGSSIAIPVGNPAFDGIGYGGTDVAPDYQRGRLVFRLTQGAGGPLALDPQNGGPIDLEARFTTIARISARAASGQILDDLAGSGQVISIADIPVDVPGGRYGLQPLNRRLVGGNDVDTIASFTLDSEIEILPAQVESPVGSGTLVAGAPTPFEAFLGSGWLDVSDSLDLVVPRPAVVLAVSRSCIAPPCAGGRLTASLDFEVVYDPAIIDVVDAIAGDERPEAVVWLQDDGTGRVRVGAVDPTREFGAAALTNSLHLVFELDDGSVEPLDLADLSVNLLEATDQDGVDLSNEWAVTITPTSIF